MEDDLAGAMNQPLILIIDDEADILELVDYNLCREGFSTICVQTGEKALALVHQKQPDLVLLDLMLPGIDGLEVAKQLKGDQQTEPIPIIMLTAKGEESDVVAGLNLGAEDYITKPFSPRILVARVRAALRRTPRQQTPTTGKIAVSDMEIDLHRHQVSISGQTLKLTFTEFHLLAFLAKRPGWVFSRSQIVDAIRGDNYSVTDRSVDVQVVGLRKKLGSYGKIIETVRGVGYRFSESA